jgi:glycosyltransferase involved in cell wall biosynthesis
MASILAPAGPGDLPTLGGREPDMKIGILVVAYNAASTLHTVLDRVPEDFRPEIAEVLVQDDHSTDATYLVALGYQERGTDLPLTIVRQTRNLGYGGNQKAGYRYAVEHGWDIVVLLHGDGQYAPELLPDMVAPLLRGEADAVFGSRMMVPGQAREGGMPLYKYLGNRILSRFQNAVAGLDLSEWHSGYRAYRVDALAAIPFERNSDGFNFDTQIILQLHDAGRRIVEIPIPTFYGDEICYVNGLHYAKEITRDTLRHRLGRAGFGEGDLGHATADTPPAFEPGSNRARIVEWMAERPPSRVLEVGCAEGWLSAALRAQGHEVTGLDATEVEGVRVRTDHFVRADPDHGLPDEVGGGYDVVIAADVIEHVHDPECLVQEMTDRLAPAGTLIASVPNLGHWYPRVRIAVGRFDYDQRGILDRTHLRFFTRRSFRRLAERSGLEVRRIAPTGLPIDVVTGTPTAVGGLAHRLDRLAGRIWPTMFAYQLVFELAPRTGATLSAAPVRE